MKNHAFIFSALFITGALIPLPEFSQERKVDLFPKPRHLEEIAFNTETNTLYLFGGAELHEKTWSEPDDFFQYNGGWKEIIEKGPIGRRGHALLFDESSRHLLMFGGIAQTRSGGDTLLFDMWSWSDGKWKMLSTKSPFKECRAVYDANERRVLVYGDVGTDERKFELWQFKLNVWKKLSDNGPGNGPFPLAYDTKRKSLCLLHWKNDGALALWEWQNGKWQTQEFTGNIPMARNKYAFAYSKNEQALLVFGGVDSKRDLLGDFWKFNGRSWKNLELQTTPSARASLRLINANGRMLLYGGLTKNGLTNELWEFRNNTWTKK